MNNSSSKVIKVIAGSLLMAASLLVVVSPGVVSASSLERGGPGGRGGNGNGPGSATPGGGYALTPLTETEQAALNKAILEEYGAYNLYQQVINQFGNVYPFSTIVLSEQQHINALVRQAEKYDLVVPENPGLAQLTTFGSLNAACQAGVEAEIADAALYDELKPDIAHSDILRVFENLQSASLDIHLPAFESCN